MSKINAENYGPALVALGFEVIGTGGGCTAWCKQFPAEHYVLITDDNCGHDLENAPDAMVVGAYDADSQQLGGNGEYFEGGFDGLPDAIVKYCAMARDAGLKALDVECMVDDALNAAVALIQKRLGVQTGDVAAHVFSDGAVADALRNYVDTEIAMMGESA
jgi:hypothetical protein